MCESKASFLASFGRYVLVTAGPVFTEEMWRLACCALQDAFSATLKPVKVNCSEERKPEQVPVFLSSLVPRQFGHLVPAYFS